ncbi:aromatic acid exporter family protein [Plantactinospora sp. BB1]|uniref:FUSC family protein n=1 Tax=Plantactinospora sp. BB1 TaxID=2071627 RepID=UPI000D15F0DC|nr:FUSC family protein [Plantactinospora sp. BB1]AVT41282.1 FUSC family protein [Plantactinospora sp. BB1]
MDLDRERIANLAKEFRNRSRATARDRWHAVRFNLVLALQAALAAALAWLGSHELLGNPSPVFAPISAIGTLASSVGQRFRRTVEMIFGIAIGIGLGDALVFAAGTGPWQLGLIVFLSIVVSIFLGGGPAVVTQAAATAVLIATLDMPHEANIEFPRVIDALIGGFAGLVVLALLLPLNPLRIVDRAARPALGRLADELSETAEAIKTRDAPRAQAALDRLRQVEEHFQGFEEALEGGRETALLAPVRWRRRGALTQYVESSEYIEHAVHNSGTLIRRAVTALEDEEPIPEEMSNAVTMLAEAVRLLRRDLGHGIRPEAAREQALQAIGQAGRAYAEGVGFSGSVVIAQVRTTGSDLLRATGIQRLEANQLVRRAAGGHAGEAAAEAARQPGTPPSTGRSGGPSGERGPAR